MIALILSIALPGALFIASLVRLLGCLKRRRDGLVEYVWATGYAMVFCLSSIWLAADLASISHGALSAERTAGILASGPQLFVALGMLLVLRPIVRFIGTVMTFVAGRLRAALAAVWRRLRGK
jgi:hypothetical protein